MSGAHREAVQKQIHQDWANREYIEVITASIKRITDFLNSFDMSCRSRLAVLNEKLTTLERRIDYLEACVTTGETLTQKRGVSCYHPSFVVNKSVCKCIMKSIDRIYKCESRRSSLFSCIFHEILCLFLKNSLFTLIK